MKEVSTPEIIAALKLAARYLEHPDVQALPFALPSSTVAQRIKELVARLQPA